MMTKFNDVIWCPSTTITYRANSCNAVSHWPDANLESTLALIDAEWIWDPLLQT